VPPLDNYLPHHINGDATLPQRKGIAYFEKIDYLTLAEEKTEF
jgi:hypothetical protein